MGSRLTLRGSMPSDPTLPNPTGPPLFTIGIPTFNRAQWLARSVLSALSQTFSSFEVLVSDNASDDETAEVLRQFSDQRLVIIRQPRNIGPTANWNACVAAARGSYIVMLSDDDIVAPHLLERCSALISSHSDLAVIVTLGDVVEPEARMTRRAVASRVLKTGVHEGSKILLEFLRGRITPQMCTIAMKTEALRARGGFPDGWPHAGDLVSWVPMLLHGQAGFVNESCGTYCSHEGTQTARLPIEARLKDLDKLACVIIDDAEHNVADRLILLEIKKRACRYVAYNCLGHMASERRRGASRRKILSVAWAWRRRLLHAGILDLATLARPVAFFILPLSAIQFVSRSKRALRSSTLFSQTAPPD
jgi:glycosyltransferase involved in cell wall biosynthesis